MPETATFLAKYGGTEVHKSKPTRESIIFDQVHKYRGTELEILTYFIEFQSIFDIWARYGGTQVQSQKYARDSNFLAKYGGTEVHS